MRKKYNQFQEQNELTFELQYYYLFDHLSRVTRGKMEVDNNIQLKNEIKNPVPNLV